MKYKLFISDYDGTLGVAPKNDIDPETVKAINEFIEKGGIFTVCSGRETSSITRILREQGLKGLVVSFQGARISDIETGEYLLEGGLDAETAVELITEVEKYDLVPLAYTGEGFFYQKENDPFIDHYEKAIRLKGRALDVKEYIRKENIRTSKICWLGDDALVNQVANEMNKKYQGTGVKFNSGAKNLLEAINVKYSKGNAVRFLSKYYGVPLDQVITVGDSTNDIDLLVGPWHGVAVGDGREELKAVADEITVPFKDKPVKELLNKYCLD